MKSNELFPKASCFTDKYTKALGKLLQAQFSCLCPTLLLLCHMVHVLCFSSIALQTSESRIYQTGKRSRGQEQVYLPPSSLHEEDVMNEVKGAQDYM